MKSAKKYLINLMLNTNLDLDEVRGRFELKYPHLTDDQLDEIWDEAMDAPELA